MHPIQPLYLDQNGVLRFKPNEIVKHLLTNGGISLNDLARLNFSREDHEQFAQLIGYSHDGFGTLSYASDAVYEAARASYDGVDTSEARIRSLEQKLLEAKELVDQLAEIFGS